MYVCVCVCVCVCVLTEAFGAAGRLSAGDAAAGQHRALLPLALGHTVLQRGGGGGTIIKIYKCLYYYKNIIILYILLYFCESWKIGPESS